MKKVTCFVCALSLCGSFLVSWLSAEDAVRERNIIVVTGNGEVKIEPDMAVVQAGAVTTGKKADMCYAENNKIMNRVMDAVGKYGIKKEDIQTIQFNLSPRYDYQKGENRFVGYQLHHIFSIKVKDIEKAGDVVDDVVLAGANEVSNISFTTAEPKKYEAVAREKAVADAREKAITLAKSAGISLGSVVRIEESSGGYIVNKMRVPDAVGFGAARESAPVMPGEIKIEVPVVVHFAIEEKK